MRSITGRVSAVFDATTSTNGALLFDDFETSTDAGDVTAPPYPVGVWHHQTDMSWARDESGTDTSVQIGEYGNLSGNEIRLGWGYDEVVSLYSTADAIDPDRTYTLSGKWEMDSSPFLPLGFIAGLAEFSASDGSVVQRLTPDTLVFGNTNSPSLGETGTFSLVLTPADMADAGIAPGNRIGIFLHHDDDGVLYSEHGSEKGDVYLVDDVLLEVELDGLFDQWTLNYGVSGAATDSDGDGLDNLSEFALGGNPADPAHKGNVPSIGKSGDGLLYVYPRRKNSGLIYWLEGSTNLITGTWTNLSAVEFPNPGNLNADFESVTNHVSTEEDQSYIRLRVQGGE